MKLTLSGLYWKHAHINNSGVAGLVLSRSVQVELNAHARAGQQRAQVQHECSMGFGDCGIRGYTIIF